MLPTGSLSPARFPVRILFKWLAGGMDVEDRPHMSRLCLVTIAVLALLGSAHAGNPLRGKVMKGTSKTRAKAGRHQLFGKRTREEITLKFSGKGDRLVVKTTQHRSKPGEKDLSTVATGRIVSDKVAGNGDRVLKVDFGGKTYRGQAREARNKALANSRPELLPIEDARARSEIRMRKDGTVRIKTKSEIRRGTIELVRKNPILKLTRLERAANTLINLVIRRVLSSNSTLELRSR